MLNNATDLCSKSLGSLKSLFSQRERTEFLGGGTWFHGSIFEQTPVQILKVAEVRKLFLKGEYYWFLNPILHKTIRKFEKV